MEALVAILSSAIMNVIILRAARRWAKSAAQAAYYGAAAGVISAMFVFVSVLVIYVFDAHAFYPPAISFRLGNSLFVGPIGGALMTLMLWRRAQSR